MIYTSTDLNLPSPLAEVLAYEGYISKNIFDIRLSTKENENFSLFVDFMGIPGLGKTTLCKSLVNTLKERICILYIPEAVNYAIEILEMNLQNVGSFIGTFNDQAEDLVSHLVKNTPKIVIIKDPSLIQNQVYRYIQKFYRQNQDFERLLYKFDQQLMEHNEFNESYSQLAWEMVETKLNPYIKEIAENNSRRFVILTTGNSQEDIHLSIARQGDPNRNQNLSTTNRVLLCGYVISIIKIAKILAKSQKPLTIIDPRDSLLNSKEKLIRLIEESYKN